MKKEALEQLRARLAYQKELKAKHTGHTHAEEVEEMWKWVKISLAIGFPITAISLAKDIIFPDHHHPPKGPLPDYMKIRNKSFPWECEDCALFDQECWNECKAEKKH